MAKKAKVIQGMFSFKSSTSENKIHSQKISKSKISF